MGIDLIRGGRIPNRGARVTKSSNTYLKTLIKVFVVILSSTHSWREEPNPNLTKPSTNDWTSPDLIAILFRCPESAKFSPKTIFWSMTKKLRNQKPRSSLQGLSLLLELSPMITDSSNSLRASKSALLDSQVLQEAEFLNQEDSAWHSTSSPKLLQLGKMFFCSEAQETDKLRGTSAYTLVRKGLTLPLVSDAKAESGSEPEEEDDWLI